MASSSVIAGPPLKRRDPAIQIGTELHNEIWITGSDARRPGDDVKGEAAAA